MPYIKLEKRELYNIHLENLSSQLDLEGNNKGDLNYCITILIKNYVQNKGKCYNVLSDITGVLNDVKTEFERKVVAPYEDIKIQENGNIYEKNS